ncbi:DUF6302 family protein [Streptomyces viridosporus]|uniref:DUF6302 family protein n=1 Tax=Streptomyces viridosporus TaxID=67581 RepID=UPI001CC72043|nr:DUF6302 family protein [Streptomyces viridosporus]
MRLLVAEDACDFEYWASQLVHVELVHVELLRDAVAVAVHRMPLLAVPAGFNRRGGHLHMIEGRCAEQAVQALSGSPNFGLLTRSGPLVSWGEPLPDDLSPEARRLFHGLREQPGNFDSPTAPAGHGGAVRTRDAGLPRSSYCRDDRPLPGPSSRPAPYTPDSHGARPRSDAASATPATARHQNTPSHDPSPRWNYPLLERSPHELMESPPVARRVRRATAGRSSESPRHRARGLGVGAVGDRRVGGRRHGRRPAEVLPRAPETPRARRVRHGPPVEGCPFRLRTRRKDLAVRFRRIPQLLGPVGDQTGAGSSCHHPGGRPARRAQPDAGPHADTHPPTLGALLCLAPSR